MTTDLDHPRLIDEHSEDIAQLALTSAPLSRLRDAILATHAADSSLDRAALRTQLSKAGLDKVLTFVERLTTHGCDRFARIDAERAEVEVGWRHVLALHAGQIGLERSLEAAERAWHEDGDEEAFARIRELQSERTRLNATDDFGTLVDTDPRV